ncbi:MAG: FkbM family methyltransferase [Planctomycetes bacterium]|nr:FkbM family methyltransferase [Planctomycetota bacterium]
MGWDDLRWLHRAWRYRLYVDPDEIRWLRQTVRPGQSAVDLGAHKGGYTYWLAKAVGRNGRVVAAEPQRELAERLARLTRRLPQVIVRNVAVSDSSGPDEIVMRSSGSSHGASLTGFPDGDPGRRIPVVKATLPELVASAGLTAVDFVKCDIEGHELRVFGAAAELIDRHRPVILCECEERHAASPGDGVQGLVRLFEPHRYAIRFFFGGALHPIDAFDAGKHQVVGARDYANNFVLEPLPR